MKKGLSRGGMIFAVVWLSIFALAFVLWAFYLGVVNDRLAEYESIQFSRVAEGIFDEYFLNVTAADMIEYEEGFYSPYDKEGAAERAIASMIDGKTLSYVAERSNVYVVLADGEPIAMFSLEKSEDRTPLLNAKRPILGNIAFLPEAPISITVIAPMDATVTVNGKKVGSDMIEDEPIYLDAAEYFQNDSARAMVIYRISGLFEEPTVCVESLDGSVRYGIEIGAGGVYSTEQSYISYLRNSYYMTSN